MQKRAGCEPERNVFYMVEVKVKDRIKELEGILKHVSGMTYASYQMELASMKKMQSEGMETFIEIDPKEEPEFFSK